MKRFQFALPLLAVALSASAADAQQRPIDAGLRRVMRPEVREAIRRSPRLGADIPVRERPLGGTIALERRTPASPARVGILARLATPGAADELRAAGAEIGVIVGDIATAWVPLDALDRVAALRGVERMEAARSVETVHDTSMIAIRADGLRQQVNGIWTGATGRGVLVGIYDTGLDLHHEDFRDQAGQTRVVALWDQLNSVQRPPTGFAQGLFCTQAEIQMRIDTGSTTPCPQSDSQGHGTHVAGTAAGDGSAGPNAYRFAGVAPDAELIVVRGGPGVFFENLIIEGLAFIRGVAAARQQPVVVNLSLGGQYGAHDGSRLYEQAIDQLSGPGFIVVVAAGNFGSNLNTTPATGERLIHARGFATGTNATEFEFELCQSGVTTSCQPYAPSGNVCDGNVFEIDFWYDALDRLLIELIRPNGSVTSASTGTVSESNDATGHVTVDNGTVGVNPDNGSLEAFISADGCGPSGVPASGTWRIRVRPETPGSGRPYDMWLYRSVIGLNGTSRGLSGFDNRRIVASPGNATRAVTVAAYATRMCWESQGQTGQSCYTAREQIGDIARFSGSGPRRDDMLKPEIAAPGVGVISSLSTAFSTSTNRIHPDGRHWVNEGTSMAAPHVTGAIAVMFQANPFLTPEAVKSAFELSAIQDGFTGRVYGTAPGASPSDWWGFGKLNVRDALLSLGGTAPAVLAVSAEPATSDTAVLGRQGNRLSLLELRFESRGDEAINVLGLTFDVTGRDPGARLLLIRDANGNGRADPTERVLGAVDATLNGASSRWVITPDSLRVPAAGTSAVLLALELSGEGPHGGSFEAALVPDATLSIGLSSLTRNPLELGTIAASGVAGTSALRSDQLLSMSENPVRGSSVHFLFGERPSAAAIYTVSGRRVADLLPQLTDDRRVEWALDNGRGARVAPGVYLIVFTVSGQTFREKLMVLTPGTSPDEME